jgi:predicted amidohydrolase
MNTSAQRTAAAPLRVALGEYDIGWHDPAASLARASALIDRAAAAGAQVVVLPEMCTTGFTMEAAQYAEPVDGPSARAIASAARSAGVYVVAGMATRARSEGGEAFYNSSILFAPDGSLLVEYRKQRLFAYAIEHVTYTPGPSPAVVTVEGVRVALFICFDLRFPELFRAIAPAADCIVVIASWPASRQSHWDTLLRARAIESQAFVIGVNRIGRGGEIDYAGGSAAYDPWGEPLTSAGDPMIVPVDPAMVADARRKFPFVEQREVDADPPRR